MLHAAPLLSSSKDGQFSQNVPATALWLPGRLLLQGLNIVDEGFVKESQLRRAALSDPSLREFARTSAFSGRKAFAA